jgi:hypothetical protein
LTTFPQMRSPNFQTLMLQLSIKVQSPIQIEAFSEYLSSGVIIVQPSILP